MPARPPIHSPGIRHLAKERHVPRVSDPRARACLYGWRWNKARKVFLGKHPLCVHCMEAGRVRGAVVVDHIIRHNNDPRLFWDEANWQPLCISCHNRKTSAERPYYERII